MKLQIKMLVAALAIASSAAYLVAQDNPGQGPRGPQGGGGPEGRRMPPPPLMAALDTNHDGVIDESEIENAPAALRALDKNGDGKLTFDELRPPRPQGRGFHGGPGPHDGPPPGNPPQQDN